MEKRQEKGKNGSAQMRAQIRRLQTRSFFLANLPILLALPHSKNRA